MDEGPKRANGNSKQDSGPLGDMIPGVDGKTQFGFPRNIITILRYVENVVLTSTTGSVAFNSFNMGSVFDPNTTGTGHQPMYFDNYAAIYQNYRVLGSRAECQFIARTLPALNTGPIIFGINGSQVSTTVSALPEARSEMNDSVFDVMQLNAGGRDSVSTLFYTYSPAEKLGRPATDDTVGAGVAASPSQNYYIQPWIADLAGGSSSISLTTCIEYTVEFFGLQNQTLN